MQVIVVINPALQRAKAAVVEPLCQRNAPKTPRKIGRIETKTRRSRREGFLLISMSAMMCVRELVQRELLDVGLRLRLGQRRLLVLSHNEILDH
jgi:hypothetical protein